MTHYFWRPFPRWWVAYDYRGHPMELNPGNTRTFTLTEIQTYDLIECVEDRIEQLDENRTTAADFHTNAEIEYFADQIKALRAILRILES